MSEEETKRQEEATQDKQSTSTKATTSESKQQQQQETDKTDNNKNKDIKPQQQNNNKNNEELIIDQVRSELETYFVPQNIQNDFNLRQKMTTDGYIDIDLLLDLKLISDLVSNRDILIEAISRSKLLVMNTGCTMVKYMPLLERNVLILRDIPTSIKKEQIITIFTSNTDNGCSIPSEIHSDIGNNWFCQFKTEEECLNTAKYLQQYGTFNNEKLHVRVKAIHDKNKADTTPQTTLPIASKSPKTAPIQSQQIPPYPQGYYQNPQYAYYGPGPGPAPPMDPYYGYAPAAPPRTDRKKKSNKAAVDAALVAPDVVDDVVTRAVGGVTSGKEEERTAISDYPGVFDKHSVQEFFDIYKEMNAEELEIPQSMRGRDFRIISEEVLVPAALQVSADVEEDDDDYKEDKDTNKKGGGRGRGRGRGRGKKQKQEISGTYYEDGGDVYNDEDGGDDNYVDEHDEEYDKEYDKEYDNDEHYTEKQSNKYYTDKQSNKYYTEKQSNKYYKEKQSNKYYTEKQSNKYYYNDNEYYNETYYNDGNRGNRNYNRNKYYYQSSYKRRGRGRSQYGGYGGYGGGYQTSYKPRGRGRGVSNRGGGQARKYDRKYDYNTSSGKHWSPRQAKQYNTNKGVYRTKSNRSNNAY